MPEVVAKYVETKDIKRCGPVLDDLIISLKSDFAKYKQRVPALRITEIFNAVVMQGGSKFNYSKADSEANHKQIKEAIDLLMLAGLVIPVLHTAASGLPLDAEIDHKKRKLILLDTGIFQRVLGLSIAGIILEDDFDVINKGAIAEQFVGLELLKSFSCYRPESLYYWQREAKSSNAEVDYVIQQNSNIVPIEVKSVKKGSMQSMHLFLKEKDRPFGIRVSLENFCTYKDIQVFPIYAISNILLPSNQV